MHHTQCGYNLSLTYFSYDCGNLPAVLGIIFFKEKLKKCFQRTVQNIFLAILHVFFKS